MPPRTPPITGAAQSVPNARVREMFKDRPEPAAPPAKERKNFGGSKPKPEPEETAPPAPEREDPEDAED